jgi:acylphosphatase
MQKQLNIKVFGRVQGVGFRYFVQKNALSLGLKGYAKNLANGSVEVIAEGNDTALNKFLDTIKKGNSLSEVIDVKIEWLDFKDYYDSFEIL